MYEPNASPLLVALAALSAMSAACGGTQAGNTITANSMRYEVTLANSLERFDVSMCTTHGRCARYREDIDEAGTRSTLEAFRVGRSFIVPTSRFLRPPRTAYTFPYHVRLNTPQGVMVSVPWRTDHDGEYAVFDRDLRFDGVAVFGRFDRFELEVGATRLEVVLVEDAARMSQDVLSDWLRAAVDAASKLTGSFPVDVVHVVVVARANASTPVPFGMAYRGGGASLLLFVSPESTRTELVEDWVAVHELSHLTLPFIREDDAWFSEGYATYFQEALRLHAGQREQSAVREGLAQAFARARDLSTGRTLADETRSRHVHHAYQRIYWSGAAIMMLADIAYHERPGACGSLREAVHRAAFTPEEMSHVMSANEVIARLDTACGTPALAELRDRWLPSADFPEVDAMSAGALH